MRCRSATTAEPTPRARRSVSKTRSARSIASCDTACPRVSIAPSSASVRRQLDPVAQHDHESRDGYCVRHRLVVAGMRSLITVVLLLDPVCAGTKGAALLRAQQDRGPRAVLDDPGGPAADQQACLGGVISEAEL